MEPTIEQSASGCHERERRPLPPGARRLRRATPALLVLLLGCGTPKGAPPVVDSTAARSLAAGRIVGFTGDYGSHVWRGIPYAAPPVGELRWRAPQPPAAWEGERQALRFGAVCPQFASVFGGVVDAEPGTPSGREDCLFLNVYAPRFTPDRVPGDGARLPVMVWLHGGGNVIGHGSLYNGGNLAVRENVIVVTANYRLGPFGWFRHAALRETAASAGEASGNFGLLDQIQALTWVRDNIAAFGGDPGNVTIFGESAGARDVFSLLVSPAAAGLFHRAIAQSGALSPVDRARAENFNGDQLPGHRNSSNETLLHLLMADGKAADRDAARKLLTAMSSEEIRAYLHGSEPFRILATYSSELGEGLIDVPNVFADGTVLPDDDWLQRLRRPDGYNQVPVMFGTNRDESKIFMFANPAMVRRILWVIPRLRDEALYQATAKAASDLWKLHAVDEPAAAMTAGGAGAVYAYRWDWDEEPTILGADLSTMVGAAHGLEIPFVFDHFDLGREAARLFDNPAAAPGRAELTRAMMAYWAEFARTGDPSRGGKGDQPEWLAWDPSGAGAPKFVVLDTSSDGGVRMSNQTVTKEAVLAAIESDPALGNDARRCAVYAQLIRWARNYSTADYDKRCAAFPLR
jgi:para-nitrobenzyl esterase